MNKSFLVKNKHLANNVQSGDLSVLSTPSLLSFIENTCLENMKQSIDVELTTLGVKVDLKHLKPNIEGDIVECKITNINKQDKKWIFDVEGYSNNIKVCTCRHTRYIVNTTEFIKEIYN
jgi:fluoroacetyl-CoA thioesterase